MLPGPALFSYKLIHQVATPYRRLRCGAPSSALTAVLLVITGIETNPGPAAVKMGLLNARSMVNKGSLVQDIIASHNLDVLAVTETWITRDDPEAVKLDAVPADYVISHLPRPMATVHSRGGGVTRSPSNVIRYSSHSTHSSASCCPPRHDRWRSFTDLHPPV